MKPLTGRRVEIHKLIKYLDLNNVVVLFGPHGVGKTRLVHEVSYFLNSRYYFKKGNYYFDCRNISTAEHCKKILKEAN